MLVLRKSDVLILINLHFCYVLGDRRLKRNNHKSVYSVFIMHSGCLQKQESNTNMNNNEFRICENRPSH